MNIYKAVAYPVDEKGRANFDIYQIKMTIHANDADGMFDKAGAILPDNQKWVVRIMKITAPMSLEDKIKPKKYDDEEVDEDEA